LVLIKTLPMDFPPMERLRRLLLTLQTADEEFFPIGSSKAVAADPQFPAWALLAIWSGEITADKARLFSNTSEGSRSLVSFFL
jgi:hypothetical protein